MTDFKPGARVQHRTWGPGTIEVGPYNGNLFVVLFDDHVLRKVSPGTMELPDPRVDVVAKAVHQHFNPRNARENAMSPEAHRETARTVLAALDAFASRSIAQFSDESDRQESEAMYGEAPARYRDSEGDTWEMTPTGRLTLVETAIPATAECIGLGTYTDRPYVSVQGEFGPLDRL